MFFKCFKKHLKTSLVKSRYLGINQTRHIYLYIPYMLCISLYLKHATHILRSVRFNFFKLYLCSMRIASVS